MKEELKPCPFCGGEAKILSIKEECEGEFYWIACKECGALIPVYYLEKNAVDAWNRRTEPEEFEWCHDCKEYDKEKHCCHRWTKVIRNTVEELKQERPKGKWIDTVEGTYCSYCNGYPYDDGEYHIEGWSSNFCPNCGADMREEE